MVLHKKGLLCFYGFHGAILAPAHHLGPSGTERVHFHGAAGS